MTDMLTKKAGEAMEQILHFLKQLAHGLAAQFGNSCEVVIHDLTKKDLDKSIVYIENGHVSNRHTATARQASCWRR